MFKKTLFIAALTLSSIFVNHAWCADSPIFSLGRSNSTLEQDDLQLVEAFYEAFEKNSEVELKNLLAKDYVVQAITEKHQTASTDFNAGSSNLFKRMTAYHEAFPNLSVRIESIIGANGRIAAQVSMTGIQKGPLFGIAPTNRYITIHMMAFFTLSGGKIIRIDELVGEYNMMKQLGYIAI